MKKNIEYGMVDLGLQSGLKWADRNVGAETPKAIGDYFMWGSTEPDTDKACDWEHAPFNNGSEEFDDVYFSEHKSEWLTDEGVLKPEYDAAHVNMGDGWRMPTSAEMQELLDGTTQTVETLNGVEGLRFTSEANGNSIFMPLAGFRYGSETCIACVGYCGFAWSSSLGAGNVFSSHGVYLSRYENAKVYGYLTYAGFVVRGVCQ